MKYPSESRADGVKARGGAVTDGTVTVTLSIMGRFGFSVILDIIKAALASSWLVNLINELTQLGQPYLG